MVGVNKDFQKKCLKYVDLLVFDNLQFLICSFLTLGNYGEKRIMCHTAQHCTDEFNQFHIE